MQILQLIQSQLRTGCHVGIRHDSVLEAWRATIETERNEYPHWVSFDGATPDLALSKLVDYLCGRVSDYSSLKRPPDVFKSDTEKG